LVNNSIRKKENLVMKFKPCPGCKTPAKCAKEGCQKEKTGMAAGGMTKKKPDMMGAGMYGGGMTKKRGYAYGGLACGASNPAERPMKTSK
jgi:hypothetical protein